MQAASISGAGPLDPLFALGAVAVCLGVCLFVFGPLYLLSRAGATTRRRLDVAIGVGVICLAIAWLWFSVSHPGYGKPNVFRSLPSPFLFVVVWSVRFVAGKLDEPWSRRVEMWIARPLIIATPLVATAWVLLAPGDFWDWLLPGLFTLWAISEVWQWTKPADVRSAT